MSTLPRARPTIRPRSAELVFLDVYDGRLWLGTIAEQAAGQFLAALADGTALGLFTGVASASHAVIDAAKGRTP